MLNNGFGGRAVLAHELRLLLYSPLTYIFLFGFVLTLSVSVFLIADFYASDQASLRLLLVFFPWVALILVPALAMRAWTDEYNDRGVELLLTLPLRLPALVIGKFLAGYCVLLTALLLTAPLVITLYYLGEPDSGRVLAGYLAMALTLGLFYALAMLMAALVKEPVGAFVLGIALLFLLLLLGWDASARFLAGRLPAEALNVSRLLSPKTHLDAIASGLLRIDNIAYFLLLSGAALMANLAVIRLSRYGAQTWGRLLLSLLATLFFLSLIIALLSFSTRFNGGLDLTEEHEFTLSTGTLDIIAAVPENTRVTLYWSAEQHNVPAAIKTHAQRVQRLLNHLAVAANGRLQLSIVEPAADSDAEFTALEQGINRTPMSSGDHFFFGATFQHDQRSALIAYFDIQRDRHLEYDIARALANLRQRETPKIGLISPLLAPTVLREPRPGLSFIETLKRGYDVAVIPYFADALPADLNALVLLQPAVLKQPMLRAIDQFLMRGGSLIVTLDPYLRFDRASNELTFQASDQINDISDLLLHYGVRYHGAAIVGDRQLASPVSSGQQQALSYPYWLRFGPAFLSDVHPTTASLNEVFFAEPGELSLEPASNSFALITTSVESGSWPRDDYATKQADQLALAFRSDQRQRIVAALAQGPFRSVFAPSLRSEGKPQVFVIADSDWLFDPFALQQVEAGGQTLTRPLNDNIMLLLNMLDFSSGEPALTKIRTRGRLRRPFSRVERLFKHTEAQYRTRQADLAQRVAAVESSLQQVLSTAGVRSLRELPEPLRAQALQLRQDVTPLRKQLRNTRRQIRERVENLGQRLTMINLLAGPTLVLILAFTVFALRRRFWFSVIHGQR